MLLEGAVLAAVSLLTFSLSTTTHRHHLADSAFEQLASA